MFDNMLYSPQEIVRGYKTGGIVGAWLDAPHLPWHVRRAARYQRDEFKAELPNPEFATAPKVNWKAGAWKGKRAFLWKAWIALDPIKALFGNQATGDCVSWGERGKVDTRRCVEIVNLGEPEAYVKRQATCLLYSGRGHTGQGASPLGIANWSTKCGILLEEEFTDSSGKKWDFREYSNYVRLGMQYGRTGMPQAIIDITSKNRVVNQSIIRDIEQLCDGLFNGYSASLGFSLDTARTGNPVSRLQGSTAHETFICGFDDTPEARAACKQSLGYEDSVIFYDQSWGKWNNVTNILTDWEPWGEGMYCHSARDCQRHLNEGECTMASGGVLGFVGTPLDNMLI